MLAAIGLVFAGATVAAAQNSLDAAANEDAFAPLEAWDEFEYLLREKYAYIDRDDFDVDAQLVRSRELAMKARNEAELRRILHRTALTFSDPHLIVGPFAADDYAIVMTAADIDARFDGARAVITDIRRGSPAFEAGLRPGDALIEIDGRSASEAALLPYGNVLELATSKQRDYGLTLAANGRRDGERILTIERPSGQSTVTIPSASRWAATLNQREPVLLEFVGDSGEVAHITLLNSLGNNATITAFDRAMEQAKDARALILDMRETPSGGNTEVARSIIGHFITQVSPYQTHRIPAFEREFTVPRQFVEYVYPRAPFFGGPVVVLHGRWTGSMGEGIVIGMDAASEAITVGSNMGDLLGGLWNYTIDSIGARVDLGGEQLLHVDGTPREDYVADVPLYPASTAPDGSDPGLAAALRILSEISDGN